MPGFSEPASPESEVPGGGGRGGSEELNRPLTPVPASVKRVATKRMVAKTKDAYGFDVDKKSRNTPILDPESWEKFIEYYSAAKARREKR